MSFGQLVERDAELMQARREYEHQSPEARRDAAEWAYDSSLANSLFNRAIALAGPTGLPQSPWPEGVLALAIDPRYAPALLTVGSIEYQCGRIEEAMKLFLTLTTLPEDTKDLCIIIDKAGDSLLDKDDYANARQLYQAAATAFPKEATYPDALGYCLAKLGKLPEALEQQRRAVALRPEDAKLLNDLGWSLVESKMYDEAQNVLEKARALAPPDYDGPKNNLAELSRRMRRAAI